jgi:hypothetical protein
MVGFCALRPGEAMAVIDLTTKPAFCMALHGITFFPTVLFVANDTITRVKQMP